MPRTLWITELRDMAQRPSDAPIPQYPPIRVQPVNFQVDTSVPSEPTDPKTTFVELWANAPCHFRLGSDPASIADTPLDERQPKFIACDPGTIINVIKQA